MRAILRILVAVKEPESRALAAVAKGAELARAAGASLDLFHALSTPVHAETFVNSNRGLAVTTSAEWDYPPHEAIVRQAARIKAAAADPGHAFAKTARLDQEILRLAGAVSGALRGRLHALHAYLPVPAVATSGGAISADLVTRIQATALATAKAGFDRALERTKIPAARRHPVNRSPVDAMRPARSEAGRGCPDHVVLSRRRRYLGTDPNSGSVPMQLAS